MKETLQRLENLAKKAVDELESRELITLSSKQLLTMIKLIADIQKRAQQIEPEDDDWLDILKEIEGGKQNEEG